MHYQTIKKTTRCIFLSLFPLTILSAEVGEESLISIETRVTILEQERENTCYWNLPFFPLSELHCGTSIRGDLLFLSGDVFHQEPALLGSSSNAQKTEEFISNTMSFWGRNAKTSLGWRLGFTFSAPWQNDWECSTTFTYWSDRNSLQSNRKSISTGGLSIPTFSPAAPSVSTTSSKTMNTFDFGLYRSFYVSPQLVLGINTGLCYRTLSLREDVVFNVLTPKDDKSKEAHIHNGANSFGPRIAFSMEWQFLCSCFLFSELATNLYCLEYSFAHTAIYPYPPGCNYFWRSFNASTSQSLSAGLHFVWDSPECWGRYIDFLFGWEMQKHTGLGGYATWVALHGSTESYTHITQTAQFFLNGAFARIALSF